jgi:septal ring factor EnvC (AmiA/AmiB activator)
MTHYKYIAVLSGVALLLISSPMLANVKPSPTVSQTQIELNQINEKINLLRRTLSSAKDRRGALIKELSATEKQIGSGVQRLRSIQQSIHATEGKISTLQNKESELNDQLQAQQQLLATHVRAHYQTGEYQPFKMIVNQDTPYKLNRILTYYQYIIKSRKQTIDQIDGTKKTLSTNKKQLHKELAKNRQLNKQLAVHQNELEQSRGYHAALISSIDHEIQSSQHELLDFENNKKSLSRLLRNLAQHSAPQESSSSFTRMNKKLPLPIAVHDPRNAMQKMNNGVTFFADEGTAVTAVHSGKIVFSDWLRGYGLLLIIDHGNGFMTLYAHNQSLFKHKGEFVTTNEEIASVGHSGGIKQNGLYFEIRLRGKAISPLAWLS